MGKWKPKICSHSVKAYQLKLILRIREIASKLFQLPIWFTTPTFTIWWSGDDNYAIIIEWSFSHLPDFTISDIVSKSSTDVIGSMNTSSNFVITSETFFFLSSSAPEMMFTSSLSRSLTSVVTWSFRIISRSLYYRN